MIKLKNNLLIKNIIILLVSGAVSKILGMLGKIIYTRIAGVNVVALYTLITPTFMLIINITQFSFPISISKISAEGKYKNNDILKNATTIGLVIDFVLMIFIFLSASSIAQMLHNKALKPAILSISVIIPFVTISSIQRGFLHGKENMAPASITNVTEEIVKVLLIVLFLPLAISHSNIAAIIFIILFNVITEITSIMIMHKAIKKQYLNKVKPAYNKKLIKEILNISTPTTLIRLISSVGFFLEPIILTNTLVKTGFKPEFITLEYGVINSYVVPLLSMPSFFSMSIASALLPNVTKLYAKKKYGDFNKKLLKLLTLSLAVGVVCLTIILLFPEKLLILIYNINLGVNYVYLMGPFFLILYMQPTLSVCLQAMGKTNKLFVTSITSMIIKYTVLYVFASLGFGMKALVYSIITGIVVTTLLVLITVLKNINKKA